MCQCVTCRYRLFSHVEAKGFCCYPCISTNKKRFDDRWLRGFVEDDELCCNYQPIVLYKRKTLVSVITLGSRNDLLKKTLNSIREHNDVNADIVITVDGTRKLPDEFSGRKITINHIGERVGICEALNRSIAKRLEEYTHVVFLDDDVRLCSSLSEYNTVLSDYPNIGIVSGYHDCRMAILDAFTLPGHGVALRKVITSGCHLVMRTCDVVRMLPFVGGHWVRPYIGFDEWVTRDAEACINNVGKSVVVLPFRVQHLGEGRSTWEGKENADEACRA